MPGKRQQREAIRAAIADGSLPVETLDSNVRSILRLIVLTPSFKGYKPTSDPDLEAHAATAREAAREGMVLLKNEKSALPLTTAAAQVALFGVSSYDFIAGGTGSGNVNHRYVVSLTDGLRHAGIKVNEALWSAYRHHIPEALAALPARPEWAEAILPARRPAELLPDEALLRQAASDADAAVITLGRTSGEFADRPVSGGFTLTGVEQKMISAVSREFHAIGKPVIAVLWRLRPDRDSLLARLCRRHTCQLAARTRGR